MAVAIEPSRRNADGSGHYIEDLVIVRAGGPQIVSRASHWGRVFESGP